MSRRIREIKKCFKVFCEGDTEYRYIDGMRRQKKLSIALKPVNMKGGGYLNFLEQVKTDGSANCLAKFIMIDGDRAVKEEGEKRNLRELLEYCILQNQSERTPHFLIVDYPDFEYVACLHSPRYKGQDAAKYIKKEMGYKDIEQFKAASDVYQVLHTKGNSSECMLSRLNKDNCFVINDYTVNKKQYEIKVKTIYNWNKFGMKSSNIDEFFGVIDRFCS